MKENYIHITEEVETALHEKRAVVALESTIITHGMPYPQNIETAHAAENTIKNEGAVPATIAVLDGGIHIGLNPDLLDRFARMKNVAKLSRADLATAIANHSAGSTTVAATMICAHLAGIEVFATGGIGGVHRGAETSFDISADLQELGRTPITVVAAGVKAILDIPKTLEVLETNGVPVIGYGTNNFPGFWSRDIGIKAPLRMDNPVEIAQAHHVRTTLRIEGGQLIANPVPIENEIAWEVMKPMINQALSEAKDIQGKDVTPYLLQKIFEISTGDSLHANQALVLSNAKLAAQVALALCEIRHNDR